jgi:type I restriction-modification system DNA methylase subunit
LAVFQLLFSKGRFFQFADLIDKISVNEQTFEDSTQGAIFFDEQQAIQNFIAGSREALGHLRLAALSRVREALEQRERLVQQEASLRREWELARDEFIDSIKFNAKSLDAISRPLYDAIERLTPRLGEIEAPELRKVKAVFDKVAAIRKGKVSAALRAHFEKWFHRAFHANSALLSLHFTATEPFRIAEAYRVWSERQSDQEDVRPEVFAEQVGYVFFVRLLLIRVLEDKYILRPRLASDGGFLDWSTYVRDHFQELNGIGILNDNYCNILARKAGQYYLHFFQQAVFDWFNPDDFLLVETLEFLCRYNFRHVSSDIIGFTYQEYIERNARNRKGHFLTPPDVVEYMLDLLEYAGPQIIGRSICDPACGSGSFLVHAARRYRQALVTYFCNTYGVKTEAELYADPQRRLEMARRYLDDLTNLFYGMELNPFACYLAEMNLLIQGLDDLTELQAAKEKHPIERFQIYNTDSLDLPYEVLESDMIGMVQGVLVPDRLSGRIIDDAYTIKAKLDAHADGFFYIISNPPYVSSKQEEMNVAHYRDTEFYGAILAGDMNLYLLFLRLGLYYVAEYGHMIFIMPLTIFGDKSASAARQLLKTAPFSPAAVIRFYRGDILFPGVDQAVAIVRVDRVYEHTSILVSGGNTIEEARAAQFITEHAKVIEAVPQNGIWQGNWLVAQSQKTWEIWDYVKAKSENLTTLLENILDAVFDRKQGDVNATYLNPLRLGMDKVSFSNKDVAIYKGEDVHTFAPLPIEPSDWAKPLSTESDENLGREVTRASLTLSQLKQIVGTERGIVLREVARLNTRERLTATWYERTSNKPIAFTHKLWRMILKEGATEEYGKAILALINSNVTVYLVNLFSTNNDVGKDDLGRVPIPPLETFPVTQLAELAKQLLDVRGKLERDAVMKYRVKLPEFDDGQVYVPPSAVLVETRLPKLTMLSLLGRGEVKNNGPANGRIRALRARQAIVSTVNAALPYAAPFARVLELFLSEPERENETWSQAQGWLLPEPIAAASWLQSYETIRQQAQTQWNTFVALQQQVDAVVADWYGFDDAMRVAIAGGLPWARRRRSS